MKHYLSPRQLRLSLMGLVLSLGAFANCVEPVLGNEIQSMQTAGRSPDVDTTTSVKKL